jgi:beta-glucosidase
MATSLISGAFMTTPTSTATPLTRADFPAGFTFGVATSSFQIEGATHEDGRGLSIWDTFCAEPGRISDASNGDLACDHYHRLESDLDLIQSLGVGAYRFSVAWPRIQPTGTGEGNEAGLAFYERLIDGLSARGIEAHMTLYHWDLPQTLQDIGGWTNREVAVHFAEYARIVASRLGHKVSSIATLNEPWCSSILSYQIGEHAPGWHSRPAALAAAHHLLLGHGLAMQAMRQLKLSAQLGIVVNLAPAYAAAPEFEREARIAEGCFNDWFLDPLLRGEYPQDIWAHYGGDVPQVQSGDLKVMSEPLDFLGVNYYSRQLIGADFADLPGSEVTDMGWEVYPQGLGRLLSDLSRDYALPPVMITENGAAFPDVLDESGAVHDAQRVNYLGGHLRSVAEAARAGVDVRAYFAWSLMDNFEWAKGYEKRFGLVYVDYATQKRTLKDSAHWYRALATS